MRKSLAGEGIGSSIPVFSGREGIQQFSLRLPQAAGTKNTLQPRPESSSGSIHHLGSHHPLSFVNVWETGATTKAVKGGPTSFFSSPPPLQTLQRKLTGQERLRLRQMFEMK